MNAPSEADLERLERLRAVFLEERESHQGTADYWESERDLELYDTTFGERIAWKWRAVFDELRLRGWKPTSGTLVDWACGSGAASRAFLESFGPECVDAMHFVDRSERAVRYARDRARMRWPDLRLGDGVPDRPAIALVSHVLGELPAGGGAIVHDTLRRADTLLWVEAGTRALGRRLSRQRERWRESHEPFAPCTHDADCGALAPGNEGQWCHFFARPDPDVFTDPSWEAFHRTLGIDRRSLPYSFLALRARSAEASRGPGGWGRFLGRSRVQKGRALVDACDSSGVHVRILLQRYDRALYRELRDGGGGPWILRWQLEGERLRPLERLRGERLGETDETGEDPPHRQARPGADG